MDVEEYLLYVVIPILSLAYFVMFLRFIKGPHVVDRVVALDLIITSGVGLIGVFCIIYDDASFLDAATILTLIAFLSTIAFAYYIDKGDKTKRK